MCLSNDCPMSLENHHQMWRLKLRHVSNKFVSTTTSLLEAICDPSGFQKYCIILCILFFRFLPTSVEQGGKLGSEVMGNKFINFIIYLIDK